MNVDVGICGVEGMKRGIILDPVYLAIGPFLVEHTVVLFCKTFLCLV